MFSHVRRPGSSREPVRAAAGARRNAGTAAPPPKNTSRFRRFVGGLAALSLAVAGGLVAAVPSAGAEQEQRYIVVLKDGAVDAGTAAATQQGSYGLAVSTVYRNAVTGYAATMTASVAARLAADPGVDFVTLAREFEKPQEPTPSTQVAPLWWLRIGGAASDDTEPGEDTDAAGVNVAVIDSGIDGSHPDLNVRGGVDCSTGSPVEVDAHGRRGTRDLRGRGHRSQGQRRGRDRRGAGNPAVVRSRCQRRRCDHGGHAHLCHRLGDGDAQGRGPGERHSGGQHQHRRPGHGNRQLRQGLGSDALRHLPLGQGRSRVRRRSRKLGAGHRRHGPCHVRRGADRHGDGGLRRQA